MVAVMVFKAWFANTAGYDKLDSEAKWDKSVDAIWFRMFLFGVSYAAYLFG